MRRKHSRYLRLCGEVYPMACPFSNARQRPRGLVHEPREQAARSCPPAKTNARQLSFRAAGEDYRPNHVPASRLLTSHTRVGILLGMPLA